MIFPRRRKSDTPKALPVELIPAPRAVRDIVAAGALGVCPFYRGYSDTARSVIATNPYDHGTQGAMMWSAGCITYANDQRSPVRRPKTAWSLT